MMKMLKNLLFTIILLIGCSFVAFGQKNDDKKNPPPKENQPKIKIVPKGTPTPPPNNNPTQGDKPKKPEGEISVSLQAGVMILG